MSAMDSGDVCRPPERQYNYSAIHFYVQCDNIAKKCDFISLFSMRAQNPQSFIFFYIKNFRKSMKSP